MPHNTRFISPSFPIDTYTNCKKKKCVGRPTRQHGHLRIHSRNLAAISFSRRIIISESLTLSKLGNWRAETATSPAKWRAETAASRITITSETEGLNFEGKKNTSQWIEEIQQGRKMSYVTERQRVRPDLKKRARTQAETSTIHQPGTITERSRVPHHPNRLQWAIVRI